jgi:hypothetical protein
MSEFRDSRDKETRDREPDDVPIDSKEPAIRRMRQMQEDEEPGGGGESY